MKKVFQNKENRIFIAVIIVTLVIASLPLFSKYCLLGHDSEYHLLRIEALKDGIFKGVPFLKINVLFFGGAGYASSMFYPDFLLYIPALLRVSGISINASWHLFIFICIALCFVSSYFSTLYITKNKYAALIAGILFTLCSYHLDDIYVRAAAGEYTAFIFIPVFLCGIYNVCYEKMDKPQLISLPVAGILLCHTLSFVLCVIIAAVIFVINYKSFKEDKKLILKLLVTAIITVVLTGFYLFPMLEQLASDTFYVSNTWIEPAQEALQLTDAFTLMFPTLGVGLLLFIFPRIIIKKDKGERLLKFADECIAIGLVLTVISTNIFPWDRLGKYISIIQFPWRLFQLSSALIAMAGAIVLYKLGVHIDAVFDKTNPDDNKLSKSMPILTLAVLIIMGLCACLSYTKQTRTYYDYSDDYYDYKPYTANVIAGEWLPSRVSDAGKLVEQSEHAYAADGTEISFERIKNTIRIKGYESEYIDVPFIYYNGYAAQTDSGQMLSVDGSAENGMTRVYTNGCADNITVYYKGTTVQLVSRILSIAAAVCLIVLFFYKRKTRLQNKN